MKIHLIREGADWAVIKLELENANDQWVLAQLASKNIKPEFMVCPDPHINIKE